MATVQLLTEINQLPLEAQKQVSDFVALLRQRQQAEAAPQGELEDEPFIGMWRDRPEMEDSAQWVRGVRRSKEWGES